MRKEIIAVMVIFVLLIGVFSVVKTKMLTYTNEELVFSIKYPEDWEWEIIEGPLETWIFLKPEGNDVQVAVMVKEGLPKEVDLEKFTAATVKEENQFYHKIKEYRTIIDSRDAIGIIHKKSGYVWGAEVKWKEKVVHIVDNSTGYMITGYAYPPRLYLITDRKYFEPMIQSFRLI